MPIIQIHMLPGRTNKEKRAVLTAIHAAVARTSSACQDGAVRAWITEIEPHGFIRAGGIVADRHAASSRRARNWGQAPIARPGP